MKLDWMEKETAMEGEGGDGGVGETPAPEAPEAGGEEWAPPGQEWYDQVGQFMQSVGPVLQRLDQYSQQPQELEGEFDQYTTPEYQEGMDPVEYVRDLVRSELQQSFQPYEPILGFVAQREAENATREALSSLENQVGKFDHDQAVFLSLGLQNQGLDPEQALRIAASRQREFEERIRNEAVEEYKTSLDRGQEVTQQPSSSTGAASELEPLPTGADKYTQLANRWAEEISRSGT